MDIPVGSNGAVHGRTMAGDNERDTGDRRTAGQGIRTRYDVAGATNTKN